MSLEMVKGFKWAPEQGCTVEFARYGEDGIAMVLMDDGERQAVATVNLAPYGSRPLAVDEVWLKGWSENEGIPEAMERAGYVVLTGETMPIGHAVAQLGKITPEALAEAALQN